MLLLVYIAALVLSTLSAFTYIYNSSHPEGQDIHALDTRLKASISDQLSEALQSEQSYVDAQRQNLMKLQRMVDEEASRGYRSGWGPGKGPQYFEKLEAFENE